MTDFYTEQLVARKASPGGWIKKILVILLTVAAVFAVFKTLVGVIFLAVAIILDVLVFQGGSVEYEYLFVNGTLDVDRIVGKSRRKDIFQMEIGELLLIAPAGYADLNAYKDVECKDCSSGEAGRMVYKLVAQQGGVKKAILFEPDKTIINGFKYLAPRKVIVS